MLPTHALAIRPFVRLLRYLLVLALLATLLPLAAVQAQADQPPFSVSPQQVNATVPLGTQRTIPITITNTGSAAATPRLYEANVLPEIALSDVALPDSIGEIGLPDQDQKVDPEILRQMAASPDGTATFLVFMDERPDLSAAYSIADWDARGAYVYRTLTDLANRSQRDLRLWLHQHKITYTPLWIANALIVEGTQSDLQALAGRLDVAALRAEYAMSLQLPAAEPLTSTTQSSDFAQSSSIAWHVSQIGADRVWQEFGINGQGIVVANIDSGVRGDHPALLPRFRGYRGGNSLDAAYNWFDAAREFPTPTDQNGHGTHVMGIMAAVGDGTSEQPSVGIAPGTQWVAARGCRSSSCTEPDLLAAAQWMLAPTDASNSNPRPDLRPHIVNGSFASSGGDDFYVDYVNAWQAAGIFPVFAAGNNGSRGCASIGSPGDYLNAVGVGATTPADLIASFSGRGPTIEGNRLKPDIVAPGTQIRSTYIGTSLYTQLQGTSMASPVVAGAVALLWAANPELIGNYAATYRLLTSTALPITDDRFTESNTPTCPATATPNNIYGYGRINIYAAVAEAKVDIPWLSIPASVASIPAGGSIQIAATVDMGRVPGAGVYQARVLVGSDDLTQTPRAVTLTITVPQPDGIIQVQGTVRNGRTRTPLSGTARVDSGAQVPVDASGSFSVTLPLRQQPYTVSVESYQFVTENQQVSGSLSGTVELTYDLRADLPEIDVSPEAALTAIDFGGERSLALSIRNTGTQPLTYSVDVPPAIAMVYRSDSTSPEVQYNWISKPTSAISLTMKDDEVSAPITLTNPFVFGNQIVEQVWIGSNGVVLFDPPVPDLEFFSPSCTSIPETTGAAIAAYRTDLDPSQGGTIWVAETPSGLVVSYEAVPPFAKPPDPDTTYSVQMIIGRDGRIVFNYRNVTEPSPYAHIAVQSSQDAAQVLGCRETAPVTNTLALQLRPQANTTTWLKLLSNTTGKVNPGQLTVVPFELAGLPPLDENRTARGQIVIESNDPFTSEVIVPVEITVGEAPYRFYLPFARKAQEP